MKKSFFGGTVLYNKGCRKRRADGNALMRDSEPALNRCDEGDERQVMMMMMEKAKRLREKASVERRSAFALLVRELPAQALPGMLYTPSYAVLFALHARGAGG